MLTAYQNSINPDQIMFTLKDMVDAYLIRLRVVVASMAQVI